jgi:hypothetical protein
MEAAGQRVPGDFCQPTFFLLFQFDRTSLLAIVPVLMGHLEQWAWMHGRWGVGRLTTCLSLRTSCKLWPALNSELLARLSKFC